MRLRIFIIPVLFFFIAGSAFSQSNHLQFKPYSPYTWMIGAGWSFVDNDGRSHSHFLDVSGAWHMLPYPSYVTVDRYLKHGFSLELALSYNQFNGAKMVNGAYPTGMMFSSDLTCRYSFYKFLQPAKWFDPYLGVGVGASYVAAASTSFYPTANGVVGVNFWIRNFGIRLQGTAKFGIVSSFYYNDTNYLQYTASLMYKFQKRENRNNSFHQPKHKWTRKKSGKHKGRSK